MDNRNRQQAQRHLPAHFCSACLSFISSAVGLLEGCRFFSFFSRQHRRAVMFETTPIFLTQDCDFYFKETV
jgi:hypothetical protein